jgi:hypothetical protein
MNTIMINRDNIVRIVGNANEYGQINLYYDADAHHKSEYIGSYDIQPFRPDDANVKNAANIIGKELSEGCNYTRTYVRREANNVFIY